MCICSGWPIHVGSPEFHGYAGGLTGGQRAPYFCTSSVEMIFHVSTWLTGDTTQRMKHLGNDEVHVVWSENSKPYRRELYGFYVVKWRESHNVFRIATSFCDVLIVLYTVSPVLVRIHIETRDSKIQFGPLFDGSNSIHS